MNAYNANKIKALECGVNLFEGDYTKNEWNRSKNP
jgi:hypothetical protein